MDLQLEAMQVAATFERAGLPYAFCGGVALAIHGYPRATKDIDVLIQASNLEMARRLLLGLGYDLEAGMLPFDLGTEKERRVFRTSKAFGSALLTIDLLLVSDVFLETWQSRETFQLDDQRLQVVSRSGLIQMKTIAGRLQDLADIERLQQEPADG